MKFGRNQLKRTSNGGNARKGDKTHKTNKKERKKMKKMERDFHSDVVDDNNDDDDGIHRTGEERQAEVDSTRS